MNLYLAVHNALREAGAASVGITHAGNISPSVADDFSRWLERGYNADMGWLHRHKKLRVSTDSVMPEAKTVICAAFAYGSESGRPGNTEQIASYACRADYHNVLRRKMQKVADNLKASFGGNWRVCIDSAPIAERYWALRSGVGFRGRNGCVIVPGVGSCVFLAELLTDIPTEKTDKPSDDWCAGCGLCIKSCPTGALRREGSIDARRCLSYLTIEKRGDFSAEEIELVRKGNSLFGCDVCQRVCPYNRLSRAESIGELQTLPEILRLSAQEAAAMSDDEFAARFAGTAIKRCKAHGLRRNARALLDGSQDDKKTRNTDDNP